MIFVARPKRFRWIHNKRSVLHIKLNLHKSRDLTSRGLTQKQFKLTHTFKAWT